ncbi:MAG TPA: alpha/beta hydrolase [Dehalococcoidia bacterium]
MAGAAPRDDYVTLPGRNIRLHYRDWGGDGPPLVLLHGLSSSCRIWDMTAPHLVERFRVVALDQRSHGRSDQPDDGYGFDDVTADLAAFIETLSIDSPAIVGHSWGAGVALAYAAARPGAVRSTVLVDGGVIDLSQHGTWEEAEPRMRPPEIDGTPVETFVGFMRRWPQLRNIWSDQLRDMVLANFDIREDGTIARRLTIENHMKIARAIFDQRPADLLKDLASPLMVISCQQEPTNEEARRWQKLREDGIEALGRVAPEARVVVMKDTIHDVPIQRPEELAKQISDFAG